MKIAGEQSFQKSENNLDSSKIEFEHIKMQNELLVKENERLQKMMDKMKKLAKKDKIVASSTPIESRYNRFDQSEEVALEELDPPSPIKFTVFPTLGDSHQSKRSCII